MSEIDDIKARIDIVEFIGKRMVLKKSGRNFKGLCPFHGEKTPSFMVSPDRQSFHCFGCGKGGSVIDFVMEDQHVEFREALEDLAELTGITLTKKVVTSQKDALYDKLLEIHHLASEYYHYILLHHKVGENARQYLKDRGVSDKVIQTFGIGYSANSWDGVTNFLKKKGFTLQELEQSGLLIASPRGGYDRFRGRLMFPIADHRGQIIAFSGRLLDQEIKEAKYINSPETPLYIKGNTLFALNITKAAIQKEETVVVMEGEFDVLSSFQAGISNVVAIKGTALTEAQVRLLKRYAKKIIFALDSDVAGDQASRRGIEIAERLGMEIYIAVLPEGKDPDDVARKEPYVLKHSIASALSIYDYYLESSIKRYDVSTAYGKKGLTEELLPLIARIENQIVQGHYVRKIADLVSLPEQTIISALQKTVRQSKRSIQTVDNPDNQSSQILHQNNKYEFLLLSLLLQGENGDAVIKANELLSGYVFESKPIGIIFEKLAKVYGQGQTMKIVDVIRAFPQELVPTLDQALLYDLHGVTEYPDDYEKTMKQTIRELNKKRIKEELALLRSKLVEDDDLEKQGVQEEIVRLTQSLRALEKS